MSLLGSEEPNAKRNPGQGKHKGPYLRMGGKIRIFSSSGTELLSYLALCCGRMPTSGNKTTRGKSVKMTLVLFVSVQVHKEKLQLCLPLATCGFLQSILLILISLLYSSF